LRNTALVTKFLLPVARVKVNFAPTLERSEIYTAIKSS
jgi:hypothetical protein